MWTRHHYPDALVVDLLKPDVYRAYLGRPERLGQLVAGRPDARTVVVDEVQRCPELLTIVHSLIEEKRNIQFILTGSSARKLKRQGVDLMAGRALKRSMHPFMAAELGSRFQLHNALVQGLIPLVVSSEEPIEVLESYVDLYVREEVQMEGLVRNIGSFSRFLEAISFSQGTVLNVSNVARECEVERNTVKGFLSVLEDLLLAFTIPIFSKRARRQLIKHPKFYFCDVGVFRSLRPRGLLDRAEEIEGVALESLVATHLRTWMAYRERRNGLYFWRTRSGVEVDFVVYGDDGLWALEVKRSSRVHSRDLRPLKAFRSDYPECTPVLLYCGTERLVVDGILYLPCEEFLVDLTPDTTLIQR